MDSEPQFKPGDRFFSHYTMCYGTVIEINATCRDQTSGSTGDPLPDTTWYRCQMDNGRWELLDDAHGDWDMARMVPERIAIRYGYGSDPKQEDSDAA